MLLPFRATQDRRAMVESSDKVWSPGEGNGKQLQCSCLEKPHEQDEQYEKTKITKRQVIVCQLGTQIFLQSDIRAVCYYASLCYSSDTLLPSKV